MIFKFFTVLFFLLCQKATGLANLKVLTTTENLMAVTKEIGADLVDVESFCKGHQDPHFLVAKPSFMKKTNQADLVIAIGLELEVAWLPRVLSGGRNPRIVKGKPGYLEVGPMVSLLEVPKGPITRADGDVHPEGNPHVDLDPVRLGEIGEIIASRLSTLAPKHQETFKRNAKLFKSRMETKARDWKKRINRSGVKNVITYHKSLTYFLDRLELETTAMLEPLPGVPPTASHILSVISKAAENGVRLILVENIFDNSLAHRVAKDVPGMLVRSVPISVGGAPNINSPDVLFETLVNAIEGK